jgi:hypothetical protein
MPATADIQPATLGKGVNPKDDHVREPADGNGPFVLFLELRVGRADRVALEGFGQRDLLGRHPPARVLPVERCPRDRRVEPKRRVEPGPACSLVSPRAAMLQ